MAGSDDEEHEETDDNRVAEEGEMDREGKMMDRIAGQFDFPLDYSAI